MRTSSMPALPALLLLLLPIPGWAQVDRATLTGVVRDPSEAVLPAAPVSVTSLATGVVQTTTTTRDGRYVVANLQPERHLVEVSAEGFQAFTATPRAARETSS